MSENARGHASAPSKVHCFPQVSSTIDVAFDLIREGRCEVWDSVIAKSQTDGRGQMRRHWQSPDGNLFGAIRLPRKPPFDSTAASVAISALCANALRSYIKNIMVKWPNDLVIRVNEELAKIAGILVEDRKEGLVAGIGINILYAPIIGKSDGESPLPPASLAQTVEKSKLPRPHELWLALVKHLHSMYTNIPIFSEIWKTLAEDLLLWRGDMVNCQDNDEKITGVLTGLDDDGAAILETPLGKKEILSGTMRYGNG